MRTLVPLWVCILLGCGAVQQPAATVGACPGNLAAYLDCGCGCCGGVDPAVQCVDRATDCIDFIAAERQAQISQASCMNAGCSLGIAYEYCDDAAN